MIGCTWPEPRAEDLKPTRLPLVFLLSTTLALACASMGAYIVYPHPWYRLIFFAGGALIGVIALMLGGRKLWTDWRDQNFYGNYQVLQLVRPNTLDSYFVNHKNVPNVVRPGWSLYLPLGGWFRRPFFSHHEGGKSRNFHVEKMYWSDFSGFQRIIVTDRCGNRLAHNPYWFLDRLTESLPEGDAKITFKGNDLIGLIAEHAERERSVLLVVMEEREAFRRHWSALREAVGGVMSTFRQMQTSIEGGDRLKNTQEGKYFNSWLLKTSTTLEVATRDAVQGFGTSEFRDGPRPD